MASTTSLYTPLESEPEVAERIHGTCASAKTPSPGAPWKQLRGWVLTAYQRAVTTPNLSELVAITLVYLVQGVTDLATLAQKYLLKDELGASPAQVAMIMSIANVPWTIKPLFGLLSDTLPLFGYRRKSHLVAAGLSGALGWLLLCLTAHSRSSAVGLIVLTSAASAASDVVVDSLVVERARREHQADSGSLQSLCWASYSVGQIGSAYFSGSLVDSLGPRPVFALTALLPLLVVLVGLRMRETRGPDVTELLRRLWAGGQGSAAAATAAIPAGAPAAMLSAAAAADASAAAEEGTALLLKPLAPGNARRGRGRSRTVAKERPVSFPFPDPGSSASESSDEDLDPGLEERIPLTAAAAAAAAAEGNGTAAAAAATPRGLRVVACSAWSSFRSGADQLWATLRRPEVAGPVVFLFCSSATPAADDAMFFFMTGPLGFTPTFLGNVQLAVAIASLVGVGLYHAFLRRQPLRRVLLWGTLVAAVCQSSSLVLATRANVALGLDDHLFALGDSVLVSVIQYVLFMPTMVLAARLCPPGMEATLFATLMSISNIASTLRYLLGGLLMQALDVTSTDFRNLPALLAICSVSLLLPLPLLAWVPRSLDVDKDKDNNEDGDKIRIEDADADFVAEGQRNKPQPDAARIHVRGPDKGAEPQLLLDLGPDPRPDLGQGNAAGQQYQQHQSPVGSNERAEHVHSGARTSYIPVARRSQDRPPAAISAEGLAGSSASRPGGKVALVDFGPGVGPGAAAGAGAGPGARGWSWERGSGGGGGGGEGKSTAGAGAVASVEKAAGPAAGEGAAEGEEMRRVSGGFATHALVEGLPPGLRHHT